MCALFWGAVWVAIICIVLIVIVEVNEHNARLRHGQVRQPKTGDGRTYFDAPFWGPAGWRSRPQQGAQDRLQIKDWWVWRNSVKASVDPKQKEEGEDLIIKKLAV